MAGKVFRFREDIGRGIGQVGDLPLRKRIPRHSSESWNPLVSQIWAGRLSRTLVSGWVHGFRPPPEWRGRRVRVRITPKSAHP